MNCGVIREADVGWEEVAHNLAKIEGVVSVFSSLIWNLTDRN
jgi:hypothetical protein